MSFICESCDKQSKKGVTQHKNFTERSILMDRDGRKDYRKEISSQKNVCSRCAK